MKQKTFLYHHTIYIIALHSPGSLRLQAEDLSYSVLNINSIVFFECRQM